MDKLHFSLHLSTKSAISVDKLAAPPLLAAAFILKTGLI